MKILKYQAGNMRQALAQIKDELGKDAMVVATRQVKRGLLGSGVEVSVAIDVDDGPAVASSTLGASRAFGLADSDVERIMAPLRSELRSLRSLLRASSESRVGDELRREVCAMREALQSLQQGAPVAADLESLSAEQNIAAPGNGRVSVLVGPTGVGKTTTIAKLAANSVFHSQESTAIVTLDTFRIGGEEQMRTYADLIGAPLFIVADPKDLVQQIDELASYDRIFVDTAGRSPRDVPAIQSLRMALRGIEDMDVHLTLALTTPANVIDSNHARYAKVGVNHIIFTKLDESIDFDELVRAPARLGIPVSYITTGQAVPEDIETATKEGLLSLARRSTGTLTEAA